jgi:threonylcarbamoyladenosine tRNA methylthiotransferase MtaB
MRKVALLTLGCRVNQSESTILEGTLKENGITIVNLRDNPEYCIVNTCTVTSKSDYNSRQLIRKAARAGARVIVTGCYAHLKPDEIRAIEGVYDVIGNKGKHKIADIITGRPTEPYYGYHSRCRPYLKVQDGCNFRCSYCAVSLARGRSVSVPEDEVIARAQLIESKGYNEIVLTGIHLGTYGQDLTDKIDLSGLVRKILLKTNKVRIRLSSIGVNEVDDELLELLQDDRLCKHLHLPVQSGCETVLKLMRRNYSPDFYSAKIRSISSRVCNVAIGTDIIVGFPGEGETEFSDTCLLINSLPFSYLHVFPFSARPGTAASQMKNRLSHDTVSGRMERIMELARQKKEEYMNNQINRTLDIIIEDTNADNTSVGTSGNYLRIGVESKDYLKGSVMAVRVNEVSNNMPRGIIISPS